MRNQSTIEQMNETIGVFMGYKMYDKRYPRNHGIGAPEAEPEKCMIIQKAKYHSSWDALMPCWKKVTDVVAEISEDGIYPNDFSAIMDMYAYHCEKVELGAAHNYVYQAIKWFNKQSTTANDTTTGND